MKCCKKNDGVLRRQIVTASFDKLSKSDSMIFATYLFSVLLFTTSTFAKQNEDIIKSLGIVDVKTLNSEIFVENAYYNHWNFIGQPIEGYKANICYLTKKAAQGIHEVQKELSVKGYALLIFDCYRPQKAVQHFATWTQNKTDFKMEAIYYSQEPKQKLISRGYISSKSAHSRASTIDLTIVDKNKFRTDLFKEKINELKDCRKPEILVEAGLLNMGTTFDCFSELATTNHDQISKEAKANRQLLKSIMEKYGFKNYAKEWWHFSMNNETYKDRYFDFDVQ